MPLAVNLHSGQYEILAHIGETYFANGDSLETRQVWAEKPLANSVQELSFDVVPDGKRAVAFFDAEETKHETHQCVILNIREELRRRSRGQ